MQIKQLSVNAFFTALLAVVSQISFPIGPVPLSLGTFGALLCGLLLRPKDALISVCAYLLLGAFGFPVFAGFGSGLSALTGLTGGYLLGYLPLSFICARSASALHRKALSAILRTALLLLSEALAVASCYLFGTLWFLTVSGNSLSAALSVCVLPFLPADLLKIVLAAWLSSILRRQLGRAGLTL